jgi:hypothetical protein
MLASYLGLTPEFLSMIRAKKDFWYVNIILK